MSNPGADYESVLAIDVGSIHTRAYLFEIAGDLFRFIGQGSARTTAEAPVKDIGEGVLQAIQHLEKITEHTIIGPDGRFIIPSLPSGKGVDAISATISAGQPIKTVIAGLLPDVSMVSAENLAKTASTRILDRIAVSDDRLMDSQIDSILKILPDLVILSGGSEDGAGQSLKRILATMSLALGMLPEDKRPEVLFAGNQNLKEYIKSSIEVNAPVTFAPNIRPQPEMERLDSAQQPMIEVSNRIKSRQIIGANELNNLAAGKMLPTANSFGRMIRFLGKLYHSQKGVIGIDVGANQTTIAVGSAGRLALRVAQPGADQDSMLEMLYKIRSADLMPWIGYNLSEEYIREYLINKAIFPATIPTTNEDLALEYALVRYRIQQALLQMSAAYPSLGLMHKSSLQAGFEPIIVSGAALSGTPNLAHCLLMILDSVQPIGVTTIVLDNNNLLSVLGAAGERAPRLPIEVLETGGLLNLATVISPVSNRRTGTHILNIHISSDDGQEIDMEIAQGTLAVIPLPQGVAAKAYLEPLGGTELGVTIPGKTGLFKMTAGALGIVIDARGRPIHTPIEILARQELLNQWLTILGQ